MYAINVQYIRLPACNTCTHGCWTVGLHVLRTACMYCTRIVMLFNIEIECMSVWFLSRYSCMQACTACTPLYLYGFCSVHAFFYICKLHFNRKQVFLLICKENFKSWDFFLKYMFFDKKQSYKSQRCICTLLFSKVLLLCSSDISLYV